MATNNGADGHTADVMYTASVLHRLYPTILPIKEALIKFSGKWQEQLQAQLVRSCDPSSYVDGLLGQGLCFCNSNAPDLKGQFTLQQQSSQMEILNRAIEALVRAPGGDTNVLCLGYRKKRPSSRAAPTVGFFGTEAHHANTTTDLLKGEAWQLLLSRIGDTLMLFLLMHTSLFLPLPNGCFLQVTGASIAEVARAKQAAVRPLPPLRPAQANSIVEVPGSPVTQDGEPTDSDGPASGLEDSWPPQGRAAKMRRIGTVGPPELCTAASTPRSEGVSKRQAVRSARPSSWARRRAAAARQAAAMNNSGVIIHDSGGQTRSRGVSIAKGRACVRFGDGGVAGDSGTHATARRHPGHNNDLEHDVNLGNARQRACSHRPFCQESLEGRGQCNQETPIEQEERDIGSSRCMCPNGACALCCGMLGTQMLVDTPVELWSFGSQPQGAADQDPIGKLGLIDADAAAGLGQQIEACAAPAMPRPAGIGARLRANAPKQAPQKPSDMLISRTGLFYRATFPSKAGLPSSHLLNALHGQKGAARSLYAAIFLGHSTKPQERRGSNFVARSSRPHHRQRNLQKPPRRIPARLKPLLAALQSLLDRSHKCPYSLLLKQHCPLPPNWSRADPPTAQPGPRTQAAEPEPCTASESGMCWDDGDSAMPTITQDLDCMRPSNDQAATQSEESQAGGGGDVGPGPSAGAGRDRTAEAGPSRLSSEELIREFVPCHRVTAFAWSVIRHVVPPGLLGDPGNRRYLRRAVSRLVRLRRYEQMSVQHALHRVRSTCMPALCCLPPGDGKGCRPPNEHTAAQRRLAMWLRWLLADLVVPLLRAHFYCTEAEAYRQQVFYYRKPVWLELQRMGLESVRDALFTPLSMPEARSILQGRQLGVASLRLLPKRTGMRPIVNLGRSSHISFPAPKPIGGGWRHKRARRIHLSFRPVNFHLQSLHKVLKFEAERQPGRLGSSVLGYNDAFAKLHPVLRQWRAKRAGCAGAAPVPYLVSADVSRAFDHVNADKLIVIVEPMLRSQEYLIIKHVEVMPAVGGCLRTAYRCTAVDANAVWPGFPAHALGLANRVSQRVFSDKVVYSKVDRAQLLQQLREHLQRNIVRFGRTWHYQCHGIPQGSTLSTLLCSLFLGSLEREHLHPLLPGRPPLPAAPAAASMAPTPCSSARFTDLALAAGGTPSTQASVGPALTPRARARAAKQRTPAASVLLRLVDDFLIITPSRAAAEALALRLLQGFPDYGVSVNPAKTRVSFELAAGGRRLPRNTVRATDGQEFMPWCGLLLNTASLDLQADYTRYAGAHLASSLTIPLTKEPGKALVGKLCAHVRPKCHPLLLDTSINSPATVRLNLFQIMLLAAMKLHCQVACISGGVSSALVLTAIRAGTKYLCALVLRRTAAAQRRSKVSCSNSISACHIRWLSLVAFHRVLYRKQSRYRAVLSALEADLRQPPFCHLREQLASVIDPAKSAVFDDIIY